MLRLCCKTRQKAASHGNRLGPGRLLGYRFNLGVEVFGRRPLRRAVAAQLLARAVGQPDRLVVAVFDARR